MLDIPDGINLIEPGAFCDLPDDLTAVFLPNSVTKLDANVFEGMTQQEDQHIIFAVSSECECLGNFPKNMVISKFDRSEKQPSEEFGINGELDSEAVGILSLIPKYAPNGANGTLEIPPCFNSIEHGATVTGIHIDSGNCLGVSSDKTVEFSEGTEEIKDGTLETMFPARSADDADLKTDVERVVIPSSCKNIEPGVFQNCINLKEIVFRGDTGPLEMFSVGFANGMNQDLGKICRAIVGNAFGNCSAETIAFPDNITQIPAYAFCGNRRVKFIVLPRNCEEIGEHAFGNCTNLKEIIFSGDKLHSIGDGAFMNNHKLKKVEIPSSCVVIGNGSFESCHSLEKVDILGTNDGTSKLCFVGARAFGNCYHLTQENHPVFPRRVTCAENVFDGCCGSQNPNFERTFYAVPRRNCMFSFLDPTDNFPSPPAHFYSNRS